MLALTAALSGTTIAATIAYAVALARRPAPLPAIPEWER
jgi:hypothetical protein